jgi:TonB family protein
MRLASAGSALCLLMMIAPAAWADCTRPRPEFQVPLGNTATAEQMATTQKQIVAFTDTITQYVRCLQGEVGQKSIGKDSAERAAIEKTYTEAHNAAADEITGLANCFNEQLESFKSSGGGTAMKPADCSKHIAEAATQTSTGAPPVESLVIESSGHRFDLPNGGAWRYLLARDDKPRRCGSANEMSCLYRAVIVMNESDETLECKGQITYQGADVTGKEKSQSQALIAPRSTGVVGGGLAKDDVSASVFDAVCTPRAKLPPLGTPANCKYEVVKPISIADYYPDPSREAGEEGPVTVEFTLAGKAANPTDVRAVASSLHPALDQAAVKAVSDMVMSSTCPKARYRLKVSFQLN